MSKNKLSLPADGERYLPECMSGAVELEHQHRYHAVSELIAGLDVLDIASGEGYGSALLAKRAKSVVGVDISEDAINYSNIKYGSKNLNLRYIHGSCASIPLADASVDAIISFETIEHHNQHEEMMAEIKRVLRPGGFLVISSPDKKEYNKDQTGSNPHHIKELFRGELEALLNQWFKSHTLYGQRTYFGSSIAHIEPLHENNHPTINFSKLDNNINYVRSSPPPIYFIAVASDDTVPKLPVGLLYSHEHETYKLWGEIDRLNKECGMLNEKINKHKRPLKNKILRFIALLSEGNIREAAAKLRTALTHSIKVPD